MKTYYDVQYLLDDVTDIAVSDEHLALAMDYVEEYELYKNLLLAGMTDSGAEWAVSRINNAIKAIQLISIKRSNSDGRLH